MTTRRWLFGLGCMVLLAGCGQGAIGWLALGGACLAMAGCARRREEPPAEPIAMSAIEAEPVAASPAPEAAPMQPPAPAEPATLAAAAPRPARARVRLRPAARPPVTDEPSVVRPMSRAAPSWTRVERVEPQVEEKAPRPIVRSRAGGRWETGR